MKKKLLLCTFFIMFINIIFAQRIETKHVKINPLEHKKKERMSIEQLYPTEEYANKYIQFLLSEKRLNIDYSFYYSTSIIEEDNRWLVLLYLDEEDTTNNIHDTFDYPIKYYFYLDKDSGKISMLYLLK